MSDFKKGDKVYIHKENDWYRAIDRSGVYTFDRYNPLDNSIVYIKESQISTFHVHALKKVNHHNTKLGKILYK